MMKYFQFMLFIVLLCGHPLVAQNYYNSLNEPEENDIPSDAKVINTVEELIAGLKSDSNLYLETGEYKLPTTLYLYDISNLQVAGADGALITGNLTTLIQFRETAKSINFDNISFSSTYISNAQDNPGQLIYFNNASAEDVSFQNCEFTCPNVESNGLKFVSEGATRSKNITIYKCNFHDIGRMAFETQNHSFDETSRITDVKVTGCGFKRLGVKSQFGMAVSLSGVGKNAEISGNTIVDAKARGIENVGWSNIKIVNNTFSSPTTAYAPITCSKDNQKNYDGPQQIVEVVIDGNKGTLTGTEDHLVEISDCDGLKFINNDFHANALHLVHTINSDFNNNTHYSDGGIGIYIELKSNGNTFKGNKFVTTADNATTVVIFAGSSGNVFQNNTLLAEGNDSGVYNDVDGGNQNLDDN